MNNDISTSAVVEDKPSRMSWSDRALMGMCFISSLGAVSANAAPISQDDYGDMFGDDYSATAKLDANTGIDFATNLYSLAKIAMVLIGFVVFCLGVLQVIKANKSNGQIPAGAGWAMVFGGAILGIAGVVFFALGSGIKSSVIA